MAKKEFIYKSSNEMAKIWEISDRTVRYYCSKGRVKGAFLTGKTWNIPVNATKPERINKSDDSPVTLLDYLKDEKDARRKGGIYHKIQIELTYNSNRIEGSALTEEQTRYIYETNTIGFDNTPLKVDDIVETANHFRCIDMIIENVNYALTESFIKKLHLVLKNGTSDSRKDWFKVGDYKKLANEVAGQETTLPKKVPADMKILLAKYNAKKTKTLEEIIAFHHDFERIHPFQDGNGRVGRLIMFKECLKNNVTPFIITEELKMFYYRGLSKWKDERGFLLDTCLTAQDAFKKYLEYFEISYND